MAKICSKCKESVVDNAKKCKHCGSDLRIWFMKHKIITVILVLFIVGIIGSMSGKNSGTNSSLSTNSSVSTEAPAVSSKITKANCDKVKTGMGITEVKNILGEPTSNTESEIASIGKSEYLHFQEGFSLEACSVTALNGKVSSRTWTKL